MTGRIKRQRYIALACTLCGSFTHDRCKRCGKPSCEKCSKECAMPERHIDPSTPGYGYSPEFSMKEEYIERHWD